MLRWLTAGESHGPELSAIAEGLPAGISISADFIRDELARRRLGYGRGSRMKFEADELHITGGVVHGVSIGSPIALRILNSEWPKWAEVMSPQPTEITESSRGRSAALTRPRPGHADLTGMQKYGFDQARPVLERASARETAARVAIGAVAKMFLRELGISILSHTVAIGTESTDADHLPGPNDQSAIDEHPVRCFDVAAGERMIQVIESAKKDGETVGGVVEVLAYGVPPGLGSYVHWDRRLDSRIAAALMGIQAIKGVEVGDGFETARRLGSEAHDELTLQDGAIARTSGRAGGIEGGMSTGDVIRARAAMKPIATVPHALRTVDVSDSSEAKAHHQRSDVCAVPAAGVVAEAMLALTLAEAVLEKFGGDSVVETRRNVQSYLESIPASMRTQH